MLTIGSGIIAVASAGVLVSMPLPKERVERMLQQAMAASLFAAGLMGFIALLLIEETIAG